MASPSNEKERDEELERIKQRFDIDKLLHDLILAMKKEVTLTMDQIKKKFDKKLLEAQQKIERARGRGEDIASAT